MRCLQISSDLPATEFSSLVSALIPANPVWFEPVLEPEQLEGGIHYGIRKRAPKVNCFKCFMHAGKELPICTKKNYSLVPPRLQLATPNSGKLAMGAPSKLCSADQHEKIPKRQFLRLESSKVHDMKAKTANLSSQLGSNHVVRSFQASGCGQ